MPNIDKKLHEATITISKADSEKISKWLTEPTNEDDYNDNYLSEDETYSQTAKFDDGYEVDVKVCGVQYDEDSPNSCWTEAVLFQNGSEVCCTDPSDEYLGYWELETETDLYRVTINVE